MHVGGRRRGKGQRLLYWFRTPPGVRVGRAPIDEAAILLLEQHNPDVQFDWTRILKDPQLTEAPPRREGREGRDGRERDGRDRDRKDRDRSAQRPRPGTPLPTTRSSRVAAPPAATEAAESVDAPEPVEQVDAVELVEPLEIVEPISSVEPIERVEPLEPFETIETIETIEPVETRPFEPTDEDRASASFARLGAEGLGRLRARYAEIMARIAERPLDEDAREELKQRAERLNPDAWVTADEVSAALEQYEAIFEGLRAVVGRYPRRRRRSRKER
jgi:hypothetical protein